MADDADKIESTDEPRPRQAWWEWVSRFDRRIGLVVMLIVMAGVSLVVVRGCRDAGDDQQVDEEAKKKKEEQAKQSIPAFHLGKLRPLPYPAETITSDDDTSINWSIKPGHWLAYSQELRSNLGDFVGDLETRAMASGSRQSQLPWTTHTLSVSRPIALPKSQTVQAEGLLLAPEAAERTRRPAWEPEEPDLRQASIQHRLRARVGGDVATATPAFRLMPDYQYHFIVLSRQPSDWVFLSKLPLFADADTFSDSQRKTPYRLIVPRAKPGAKTPPPLPSNPLAWSTIANLVWDGYDADELSTEQQQALVTWLHWGGRLIVNGPTSLDGLRNKFLDAHLPATGEAKKLDSEFAALNQKYPLSGILDRLLGNSRHLLPPGDGLDLKLRDGGEFVSKTGDLIAQRRVGRGHVLVTAFRMALPQLRRTGGNEISDAILGAYSNLVCQELLDRPWRHHNVYKVGVPPNQVTDLRWLSRDTKGTIPTEPEPDADDEISTNPPVRNGPIVGIYDPDQRPTQYRGGIGAWNDASGVSNAARQSLREAAGITVPKPEFVMWVLLAYLVALAPLNWLIFRLIGRVEWAWIAVPVMSIGCTIAVVKLAELDIGFARSRTEIALVEMQPGFARAHVTRYGALYTSFSTGFDVRNDDPHALLLPFAKSLSTADSIRLLSQRPVDLRRDGTSVTLSGMQVTSNSTDLLHTEEMRDLGGTISLLGEEGNLVVQNGTSLNLSGAIVRRLVGKQMQQASLGEFPAGGKAKLQFENVENPTRAKPGSIAEELSLAPLLATATDVDNFSPGEIRLIATTRQPIAGMEVDPTPSQQQFATVVVAHLRYGK